jgi:hypothetical protein
MRRRRHTGNNNTFGASPPGSPGTSLPSGPERARPESAHCALVYEADGPTTNRSLARPSMRPDNDVSWQPHNKAVVRGGFDDLGGTPHIGSYRPQWWR